MTTDSMFKILRGNHEESGLCNACHRPMIPVIYKGKPTISGHVVIVCVCVSVLVNVSSAQCISMKCVLGHADLQNMHCFILSCTCGACDSEKFAGLDIKQVFLVKLWVMHFRKIIYVSIV